MKKVFTVLAAAMLAAVTLGGCITIYKDGETEESKNTEAPVESSSEELSSEVEESSESDTVAPEESSTEYEGGHHTGPEEPETDESGMRYTYKWLAGLYQSKGEAQASGFVPGARVLFYENGLYAADKNVEYSSWTEIGSYRIAGDTVYLQPWFCQGGDVGLNPCLEKEELVIGINMDGTLIDGGFNEFGMVFIKQPDSDIEEFKKWNGVEEVLQGTPVMNEFAIQHPEFFNP